MWHWRWQKSTVMNHFTDASASAAERLREKGHEHLVQRNAGRFTFLLIFLRTQARIRLCYLVGNVHISRPDAGFYVEKEMTISISINDHDRTMVLRREGGEEIIFSREEWALIMRCADENLFQRYQAVAHKLELIERRASE